MCYLLPDGSYETIPANSGIQRFIWEHFQNINHIIQHMKYSSSTFSGTKSMMCIENFIIISHYCMPDGRKPDTGKVDVICNWGTCHTLSKVRAFLGTVGLMRIYIQNYTHRIHALNKLTRKDVPFKWGPEQIAAQDNVKQAVLHCPVLKLIDYTSNSPIILAVDTLKITVGFFLCQQENGNVKKHIYNRFRSITLNDCETHFSQSKLEIFRLYCSLHSL